MAGIFACSLFLVIYTHPTCTSLRSFLFLGCALSLVVCFIFCCLLVKTDGQTDSSSLLSVYLLLWTAYEITPLAILSRKVIVGNVPREGKCRTPSRRNREILSFATIVVFTYVKQNAFASLLGRTCRRPWTQYRSYRRHCLCLKTLLSRFSCLPP